MSRRKREESGADALFDALAMAPVWVGPVFAAAGFVVLRYAAPPLSRGIGGELRVGEPIALVMPMLAWLFAGGVLLIWIAAEFRKWVNRRLLDRQTGAGSVRDLSWAQFEQLVAEAYRRRGYVAQVIGRAAADGGVDIELHGRGGEGGKVLVQCKHWKARQVGVKLVRELAGVVAAEGGEGGAAGGVLVTSGRFTPDAVEFAAKSRIELVDRVKLARMIAEVQRQSPRRARSGDAEGGSAAAPGRAPVVAAAAPQGAPRGAAENPVQDPPQCPTCREPMVLRTARRGERAGSQFWGCPRFPECRGTRELV